jgi:prepilin-type processing-associated H-X9-DG protein
VAPATDQVWVFIEPTDLSHDAASWDFFVDQLNVMWAHQPSDRHASGCNLSFLDGHVQPYRWKASHQGRGQGPEPIQPGSDREDYRRLLRGVPRTP